MKQPVAHWLRWLIGAAVGGLVVWWCWRASSLGDPQRHWAAIAIVVSGVVIGEALPDAARMLPEPGLFTGVLVMSLAAAYACVPETDQIPGIAVVLIAVGAIEVLTRQTMPIAWHALAAALVLWAGAFGATGRQRAFVGALFGFWPVVLLAIVVRVVPGLVRSRVVPRALIALLGGAGAVWVGRTGALHDGRRPAVRASLIAASATLAAALLVGLVSRARPLRREQ